MTTRTPSKIFVACLLLSTAIIGGPLRAEDALDYVAGAFKTQQAAYPRKVVMNYKLGAADFSTEMIQESKSKLNLKTKSNGVEKEFIMIEAKVYVKSGSNWIASQAPIQLPEDPVPIDELKRLVVGLAEQARETTKGRTLRVFSGVAKWSSGKSNGVWTVAIDHAKQLPVRVSFSGECEGMTCSMTQIITYDRSLQVSAP